MPIYTFLCRTCKDRFEQKTPVGVRFTTCPCGHLADKQFVPTAEIRVTEGFRTVNRSDVCAEKGKDWFPRVWPSAPIKR